MGNQMIMLLVVGSLLGLFGGNMISKLNPFKTGRVAVVKQESSREEYFKDKVKGIEYRMTERNKGSAPAKQTLGQSIGNFIDKSLKAIVMFFVLGVVLFLFTGINIFKYVRKLKGLVFTRTKALRQTVAGVQDAKVKMNGEHETLKISLRDKQDEDTELLIKQIKLGKTDEKSI